MTPQLRPYQSAAVEAVRSAWGRGLRRVLLVSPVGSGKTLMATTLVARVYAAAWAQSYWIAHNDVLVEQPSQALAGSGVPHAFVKAGRPADALASVQVCSVQSLVNHAVKPAVGPDGKPFKRCVVVVDECHKIRAATYLSVLNALSAAYEAVYMLLLTATPYRLDGRGMGDAADVLIEAATPRQLMDAGHIVEPTYWSTPPPAGEADEVAMRPPVVGDAVATWKLRARGLPTIGRGRSIAHSKLLTQRFLDAGVRAAHVDGSTPLPLRRRLACGLAVGGVESSHPLALDVLFSGSNLFDEGFDSRASWEMLLPRSINGKAPAVLSELRDFWTPGADQPPPYRPLCVLLDANATASAGTWMQLQGRVVRSWPGKDRAIVLCHSGNLERHGFLCTHDSAHYDFALRGDARWSPKLRQGGSPKLHAASPLRCSGCLSVEPPGSTRCRACGADVSPPQRLPEEDAAVDLVESPPTPRPVATPKDEEDYLRARYREMARANASRTSRGEPPYKPGWPAVRFKSRFGRWPHRLLDEMVRRETGFG